MFSVKESLKSGNLIESQYFPYVVRTKKAKLTGTCIKNFSSQEPYIRQRACFMRIQYPISGRANFLNINDLKSVLSPKWKSSLDESSIIFQWKKTEVYYCRIRYSIFEERSQCFFFLPAFVQCSLVTDNKVHHCKMS